MDKEVPIWLERLDLLRTELKGMRFTRTAEEGLRQYAKMSAVSMELLKHVIVASADFYSSGQNTGLDDACG